MYFEKFVDHDLIYRWIRFAVWPQSGKIKGIMERLYKAYYRVGSIFIVTLLAGLDHLTITLSSHWFTLYPNLTHTSQHAGGKQQPGYLCVVPHSAPRMLFVQGGTQSGEALVHLQVQCSRKMVTNNLPC